jgi:nitroimidazol reductase NimA-like FMN-containing flavoprotein (pyridoxamine 5'-phosphate oxidase superfamily)
LVVEPLSQRSSWDYLQSTDVGRLALTSGALPVIVPVAYTVVDDAIVFRTGPHRALSPSTAGAVVAFETGDLQLGREEGWSVLVRGVVHQLGAADPLPHGEPPHDVLLALQARIIEGSRVHFDPPR